MTLAPAPGAAAPGTLVCSVATGHYTLLHPLSTPAILITGPCLARQGESALHGRKIVSKLLPESRPTHAFENVTDFQQETNNDTKCSTPRWSLVNIIENKVKNNKVLAEFMDKLFLCILLIVLAHFESSKNMSFFSS